MFHQFRREVPARPGTCRSRHQPRDGTGISATGWRIGIDPARLGTGAAGTGAGRDRADPPGLDSLSCHGSRRLRSIFSGTPRRSPWTCMGQPEAGLTVLAEALTLVDNTGERWYEARAVSPQGRTPAATVFGQSALKPKPVSITPLRSPKTNKPSPSNYEPPPVSLDSGSSKANARKPMTSWHQSTVGSPKDLIRLTCRMRRRCWTN